MKTSFFISIMLAFFLSFLAHDAGAQAGSVPVRSGPCPGGMCPAQGSGKRDYMSKRNNRLMNQNQARNAKQRGEDVVDVGEEIDSDDITNFSYDETDDNKWLPVDSDNSDLKLTSTKVGEAPKLSENITQSQWDGMSESERKQFLVDSGYSGPAAAWGATDEELGRALDSYKVVNSAGQWTPETDPDLQSRTPMYVGGGTQGEETTPYTNPYAADSPQDAGTPSTSNRNPNVGTSARRPAQTAPSDPEVIPLETSPVPIGTETTGNVGTGVSPTPQIPPTIAAPTSIEDMEKAVDAAQAKYYTARQSNAPASEQTTLKQAWKNSYDALTQAYINEGRIMGIGRTGRAIRSWLIGL